MCSHLHIHHIGIGLHQAVAHMQRGLKADLRLLHGDHGLLQADGGVFQLHLALQFAGMVLCAADRLQCALQGLTKAAGGDGRWRAADFAKLAAQLGGERAGILRSISSSSLED